MRHFCQNNHNQRGPFNINFVIFAIFAKIAKFAIFKGLYHVICIFVKTLAGVRHICHVRQIYHICQNSPSHTFAIFAIAGWFSLLSSYQFALFVKITIIQGTTWISAKCGHGEFLPDSPFLSGPIRHFVNFSTSQAAPLVIYLNFHQPAFGDYFFLPDSSLHARISGLYCRPWGD